MGKKSPNVVQPPDPVKTAQAQTDSNVQTATANQRLNMINTTDPYGSVNFSDDPSAPGGYRQTTQLSPTMQTQFDLSNQASEQALGLAGDQIGRVGQALGQGFSYEGLPALQGQVQGGPVQSQVGRSPGLAYGFDQGQNVQGQVGPQDFSQDRRAVTDAVMGQYRERLDPVFDRQQSRLDTRLANQGLGMNSTAARGAQDDFGRQRNDAYGQAAYQAVQAGANEQNTLFGQQVAQGQFANQAAAQQYAQGQGASDFYNQAAQQQYGRNLTDAGFANEAQGQQFQQALQGAQFTNQARTQGAEEQAYAQNLPLNQFNALMSSSQVGTPQGVGYTPAQQANTDVLGAYALNQQAQQANAQRKQQANSGMMNGLFSLGSAALLASDERLKTDLKRVGQTDDGVGIYTYRYKSGGPVHMGVLAQEVARVNPSAVGDIGGGFLGVDYGRL